MADLAAEFQSILGSFVEEHHLGVVYGTEMSYMFGEGDKQLWLAPSVAFIAAERVPASPPKKIWPLAPDLVIEVTKPKQTKDEMRTRARQWMLGGTRLVWVAWPQPHQVDVWRPTPGLWIPEVLQLGDILDGQEVVPGFTYALSDMF